MPASPAGPIVDTTFFLRTLGAPQLTRTRSDGTADVVLRAGKPLAALAYLALGPQRAVRRDQFGRLLWSDAKDPLNSVRNALATARALLGDVALPDKLDPVELRVPVANDRDALVAAYDRGDTAEVLRRYDGPFFTGYSAGGAGEFERWVDGERERLRRLFVDAARREVDELLERRDRSAAKAVALRVRHADPAHDVGWRLLLRCLVADPNLLELTGAVAELDENVRQETLALEPETELLLEKARQLAQRLTGAGESPSFVGDMIGRETQRSAILHAWLDAQKGRTQRVTIVAGPGLGKTRLLDDVGRRLRHDGARVVAVRGAHGARDLAYALASDVVSELGKKRGALGLSTESARLLVELAPALEGRFKLSPAPPTDGDLVVRRAHAARDLLGAITDSAPIALLIDDLHWADAQSRRLLDLALAGLDDVALLAVTASRRPLGELGMDGRGTELRLDPLAEHDVGALLASIAPLPRAA